MVKLFFKYFVFKKIILFFCRIDLYEGNLRSFLIWGVIMNYLFNYVNVKFFIINKYFNNFRVFFVVLYDIV